MVRIRLQAAGERRSYDSGLGRFTDAEAIPCFRCGVCCRRWQPLIGPLESERLAQFLHLSRAEFLSAYTRPYPLAEETYQLRERNGGCIFLGESEPDGRSTCRVHEARPQACRDWDASLWRRECRDGLDLLPISQGLAMPVTLYDDPDEVARLSATLRDESRIML